jgi:hypothetical protein
MSTKKIKKAYFQGGPSLRFPKNIVWIALVGESINCVAEVYRLKPKRKMVLRKDIVIKKGLNNLSDALWNNKKCKFEVEILLKRLIKKTKKELK